MGILKTGEEPKTERLNSRCTLSEYYDIKKKALLYCDGNISEYVIYASKNYTPARDELKGLPDKSRRHDNFFKLGKKKTKRRS